MSETLTYKEYAERIKASDREAFSALFNALREALLRYVRSIVKDEMTAHDLVQDVFLSLWKQRASLDPSRSLKAYLYQVARNRAIRFLRDERTHHKKHTEIRMQNDRHLPVEEWPDAGLEKDMLVMKLRSWVNELPDRQREALELSRYQGFTHKEIAELMGVSPRTVNAHITLAMKNLHRIIESTEPILLES